MILWPLGEVFVFLRTIAALALMGLPGMELNALLNVPLASHALEIGTNIVAICSLISQPLN